jgi:hypothetical protein
MQYTPSVEPRREGRTLILLVLICSVACQSNERAGRPSADAPDPARITQFYSTSPSIPRGESANLCYGVDNAAAVRIDPPVESLKPALSRCISIAPSETTTYTLTAEDRSGKTTAHSVTVRVTGPRPHFDDLSISSKEVAKGEAINFCFKAKNAVSVKGGPGKFLSGGLSRGDCLLDRPLQTTTYTLTITSADGETDQESVTVKVH